MEKPTRIFKPLLGYVIALAIVWILVPSGFGLSDYKFNMKDGRLLEASISTRPVRLIAQPSNVSAKDQFRPRQDKPRQFHFKFDENWPVDGPRIIYIPSTGAETRIYVNGVPQPREYSQNLVAAGLGSIFAHNDLLRADMVPGINRFDVYVHEDDARAGVREIYIGPKIKMTKMLERHANWAKFLPVIGILGSFIAIVIAMAGFIFGTRYKTYLIIGISSCALIAQAGASLLAADESVSSLLAIVRYGVPPLLIVLLGILMVSDRLGWTWLAPYKWAFLALALTGPVAGVLAVGSPFVLTAPVFLSTLLLIGALPLFFVLGGQRLSADLTARRSQLEALRARVSEQEIELGEKGQALAQEMRNRAVLEERQRFTRDIHDGIGGQLLSLILKVRTGKLDQDDIVSELQAGLNDLRLVVDSMDHTGGDLKAALTTFRSRAGSQVKAANIDMDWQQDDPLFLKIKTTNGTLNIYRFMQEAFTNIIRHAQASQIQVEIRQGSASLPLTIRIADDGVGFENDKIKGAGKGLANLKNRAAMIGGEAVFTKGIGNKGAGVELVISPTETS